MPGPCEGLQLLARMQVSCGSAPVEKHACVYIFVHDVQLRWSEVAFVESIVVQVVLKAVVYTVQVGSHAFAAGWCVPG